MVTLALRGHGASSIEITGDAASSASSVRRPSTVMAGRPVVSTMPWRRSVKSRSRSSRLLRARFGLLVLLGMLHMVPRDSNAASRNSGVGRSQAQ